VETFDVSPEGLELSDDAFVALVTVNAIDDGFAFGHQRCEYQPPR
jgi:hypothetical protein